jgi:hypothetical protein
VGPKVEGSSYVRILSAAEFDLEWPGNNSNTLAIASGTIGNHSGERVTGSIEFNGLWPFTMSGAGNTLDLQSVMTHEFGHWLGLKDIYSPAGCGPSGADVTMWHDTEPGQLSGRTLASADITGLNIAMNIIASSPGSITASATPGAGFVHVQWTDTNPSGGDPFNYTVLRATDCRGPYSVVQTVPKNQGFNYGYLDNTVTENRPYHYYVTDGNCASAGAEPWGLSAPGAPPASPTSLTANWTGSGGVELEWSAPAGTISGYRIWRNAGPASWISNCENLAPGTVCPDLNPDVRHTATTQSTIYLDNVGSATQASYQVSAYTVSNGNYNYSPPATVNISCGPAIVTVANPTLAVCPAGGE